MGTTGLGLVAVTVTLAGMALLAYSLRALNVLGAVSSFVLGMSVTLSAGLSWLALLVCFTGLGVLATRVGYARKKARMVAEEKGGERGVTNVFGNGLAPLLVALLVPLQGATTGLKLAYVAAIAAVTADTLASEIGVLADGARMIIPPFARVPVGRNGAVSILGQAAAFLGAGLIAVAAHWLLGLSWAGVGIAAVAGWFGCQVDSLLGATVEKDAERPKRLMGKQGVNFLCGAVPAAIILAATWAYR